MDSLCCIVESNITNQLNSNKKFFLKMWYIYTVKYYSAIKKEQNNVICSNMDTIRDYHAK